MTIQHNFGTNLRVLMAERDITAKKISVETGISESTISKMKNESTNSITFDCLQKLTNYFRVPTSDFFKRTNIADNKYYESDDFEF